MFDISNSISRLKILNVVHKVLRTFSWFSRDPKNVLIHRNNGQGKHDNIIRMTIEKTRAEKWAIMVSAAFLYLYQVLIGENSML